MVVYELGQDGSFVAGDTETGLTCYAYPTSNNATLAARRPNIRLKLAKTMMRGEAWRAGLGEPYKSELATRYDARNWARLTSRRMEALEVAEG